MSGPRTPAISGETASSFVSPPMYFPVSVVKLVVMSTCTFGIYELYWFYKNWCLVRDRGDRVERDIMPLGRALFPVFFCYSLFDKIRTTAERQRVSVSIAAGPLATGWIVLTLCARLPVPYWLVGFAAVGFLVPVQDAVSEINQVTSPQHDTNSRFTQWNIAGVVVGGLLWVLVVIGAFFPIYS